MAGFGIKYRIGDEEVYSVGSAETIEDFIASYYLPPGRVIAVWSNPDTIEKAKMEREKENG